MSLISFVLDHKQNATNNNQEPKLQISLGNKLYVLSSPKLYYTLNYIEKLNEFTDYLQKHGMQSLEIWFKKHDLLIEEFIEPMSEYWFTDIETN